MAEKLPLFKLSIHPLQTCDPENYANPVSVSTTPYTGDGAGVGLAESGDAHPTPATPLSPGASSVCVKPNEPNPDLTDCSQVTQSLCKDRFTESLVEKKICQFSADAHKLSETKADLVTRFQNMGACIQSCQRECFDAMNRDRVRAVQNFEGHTIWIFVSISCSRD